MFKKTEPKLSAPKIILFIPFTVSENNFSLYIRALDWRNNLSSSGKSAKVPSIVMYRHPDENEQDFEDYDLAQFCFTQENLTSDSVIYVLADGTGDPEHVINVNQYYYKHLTQEPYQLSIDAVAWRMKQCGLTPELAQNLKAINLFMCDEDNNNDQLAAYFAQELGEKYKNVAVNYYSAIVNLPRLVLNAQGDQEVKKLASFAIYLNDGSTKFVKAGYAHEHKHSLKVSDALAQERSSSCSAETRKAKAERLPSFKELSAHTIPIIEEIDTERMPSGLEQEYQPGIVTFPEDDPDIVNEVNITGLSIEDSQTEYQLTTTNQCRAIVVWQERTSFSFFKSVEEAGKKDKVNVQNAQSDLTPN
ncbi:Uncharacterised protein [Legionella steigerwaltii]|uniref:Uncharacterized protein n=1 Tax=Legionella steigerwaltii TaxID=460 RepID=A0A378L7J7_9GAMM|nr:hypothetical protein [Legionella steigerwaltii]KTD77735.1 hypothetical protein Lstg_2092 [Legionella steigerwaltii]STY23045.1 Uncharacterised protein [Legionella steigerwaltii]